MAATVLADAGFLIALLRERDVHREWAGRQAAELRQPWHTCEAVLSEILFVLGKPALAAVSTLLRRRVVIPSFRLDSEHDPVLRLMRKYADVPMSLADACLVRMSETYADPIVVTTDSDFHIYRRHSRQTVPCMLPN